MSLLIGFPVGEVNAYFKSREITCGVVEPPFIVRLDGVKFGNRLREYEWPRDRKVHEALIEAAKEIMQNMGADMAHVVSDEINVFFLRYMPYGGRVFKIISITAGIAAATVTKILQKPLYFDSRVIKIDKVDDVIKYVLYRARVGTNNYLGSIAARKRIYRKGYTPNIDDLICDLRQHVRTEPWKLTGTLVYKKKIVKRAVDKLTGREVEVTRNVLQISDVNVDTIREISAIMKEMCNKKAPTQV